MKLFRRSGLTLLFFLTLISVGQAQVMVGQAINWAGESTTAGDIISRNRLTGEFSLANQIGSSEVFGVVVDNPTIVLRAESGEGVQILRSGQTEVRVSLVGGLIMAGDYITTSSIPGLGQRASEVHRYVVGMALESFNQTTADQTVVDPETGVEYPAGLIMVDLNIGPISLPFLSEVEGVNADQPASADQLNLGRSLQADWQTIQLATQVVRGRATEFITTTEGQTVTQVVATGGVIAGLIRLASLLFFNPSWLEFLFLPLRLVALVQSWFGFRGRSRPWGTIYDSVTKQPLDPVYVTLTDPAGLELKTSISDINGRYGFLVSPGQYRLKANKTNYTFPSKKLVGRQADELYDDLYFGDVFEVKAGQAIIAQNIPMDPTRFDWNEFKKQSKRDFLYFSYLGMIKEALFRYLFYFGFLLSVPLLILVPVWYNFVIVGLYLVVLLFRLFGVKARSYGRIKEVSSGAPVPFALLYVHLPNGQVIAKTACDQAGRYFILVDNGHYYVTIHRKQDDGQYYRIHTADVFEIKKGIINRVFKV